MLHWSVRGRVEGPLRGLTQYSGLYPLYGETLGLPVHIISITREHSRSILHWADPVGSDWSQPKKDTDIQNKISKPMMCSMANNSKWPGIVRGQLLLYTVFHAPMFFKLFVVERVESFLHMRVVVLEANDALFHKSDNTISSGPSEPIVSCIIKGITPSWAYQCLWRIPE